MSTFSFPILKISEISACLTELGWPLTTAQLSDPREEDLFPVLIKLLEHLKGISRDEMKQLDFRGIEILSYPELHDDSIVEMGILKELCDLIRKVGVHDVSINDILTPEKKRIAKIFSGLINFAKFREDKLEYFQQFTSESTQLAELRQNDEVRCEELEKQRQQAYEQNEVIKPQIQSIQAEVDALKITLNTKVQEQTQLREEMKSTKAVATELQTKIQERDGEINTLHSDITKIRSQIISDPEGLKQQLKEMSQKQQQNRTNIQNQIQKQKQILLRNGNLSKLEEKLVKRIDLLKSYHTEQQSLMKVKKHLQDQSSSEQDLRTSAEDMEAQEDQLKENLSQAQEKLFNIQKNFETKRMTAQTALQSVTQEKLALEKLLQAAKNEREQNEALMQSKKTQLSSLQTEHSRTMQNLKGKYTTLQSTVGEYHMKLKDVMQVEMGQA